MNKKQFYTPKFSNAYINQDQQSLKHDLLFKKNKKKSERESSSSQQGVQDTSKHQQNNRFLTLKDSNSEQISVKKTETTSKLVFVPKLDEVKKNYLTQSARNLSENQKFTFHVEKTQQQQQQQQSSSKLLKQKKQYNSNHMHSVNKFCNNNNNITTTQSFDRDNHINNHNNKFFFKSNNSLQQSMNKAKLLNLSNESFTLKISELKTPREKNISNSIKVPYTHTERSKISIREEKNLNNKKHKNTNSKQLRDIFSPQNSSNTSLRLNVINNVSNDVIALNKNTVSITSPTALFLRSISTNKQPNKRSNSDKKEIYKMNKQIFTEFQKLKINPIKKITLDNFKSDDPYLIFNEQKSFQIGSPKYLKQSNLKNLIQKYNKKDDWLKLKLPITGKQACALFSDYLLPYEQKEIQQINQVYCIGINSTKCQVNNHVHKEEETVNSGEEEYEIIQQLGRGSFGQVVKVFDHKFKKFNAIKIIKNHPKFYKQAQIEQKLLNYIKSQDQDNTSNVIEYIDYFQFRNHMCLVFELLGINLYEFLQQNQFQGIGLDLLRKFSIQILYALLFLNQHKVIHCDLKPENILLKEDGKSGIKVIDFGSSCFENEKLYSYIQSRFYRSPEVILGLNYDTQIDMWSFGCILVELLNGNPLFPGEDEIEQFMRFVEILGLPDDYLLETQRYIDPKGVLRRPSSIKLDQILQSEDISFINFVECCLIWDPNLRMTPQQALLHEWILKDLAPDIRSLHLQQVKNAILKNQIIGASRSNSIKNTNKIQKEQKFYYQKNMFSKSEDKRQQTIMLSSPKYLKITQSKNLKQSDKVGVNSSIKVYYPKVDEVKPTKNNRKFQNEITLDKERSQLSLDQVKSRQDIKDKFESLSPKMSNYNKSHQMSFTQGNKNSLQKNIFEKILKGISKSQTKLTQTQVFSLSNIISNNQLTPSNQFKKKNLQKNLFKLQVTQGQGDAEQYKKIK